MECFLALNPEEIVSVAMTQEQKDEIEQYYRDHPIQGDKDAAISAFQSITPTDLSVIEGLPPVIERLCQSLRDLRRESPKSFFGHPVERLYDSLEAALADFYRSQVESTSSTPQSDPGAI